MTQHTEPYRLDFPIPPDAPIPVAEARENFRRLCDEYSDQRAQLNQAPQLREAAIREAREQAATARVEGSKPPPSIAKLAQEWDTKIAKLEEEVATTAEAVRQAYEVLVRAIAANRDEWLAAFIKQDKVETTKLVEEIEAVEDRLERLSHVRGAPFWLVEFDLQQALVNSQRAYPGGHMRASFGNLWQIANPPMELAHFRKGIPIYTRVYSGETNYVYADGTEIEPEILAEIQSGGIPR